MTTQTPIAPAEAPKESLLDESLERCEKCGAPTHGFAVCRACGYYAKLGQYVEIDYEMEGFEVEKPQEPFRLPTWCFGAIITSIGVLAEALTLSFLLPLDTLERLLCSIMHMVGGILLLIIVQVRATFLAMMDDMEISAMDCVACPPKAWGAVVRRLPESRRLITLLSGSVMAILMSLLVLRAIPYGWLFYGEPPPKLRSPVVDKVLGQAPAGEEMDLEEAIQELAEKGSEKADEDEESEEDSELVSMSDEEAIKNARAVVIGFNATASDPKAVRSVVVATANLNPLSTEKWRVLGTVPIVDEQQGIDMYNELTSRRIADPITETHIQATWVKPSIKCEVSFQERGEDNEPVGLELKKVF